jgi:hypothetical protein
MSLLLYLEQITTSTRRDTMNTTSTEDQPVPAAETWSDKSKKDMFLGLILVIAAIGSEPLFDRLGSGGIFFQVIILSIGIIIALIGYFSLGEWLHIHW